MLWISIGAKKHKKISAMKARQWTNQLLARSILLGSSDGVSMHDSKWLFLYGILNLNASFIVRSRP